MRVLRATIHHPPNREGHGPVTMVMRDSDIAGTLADAVEGVSRPLDAPAFIVTEVFTVPDGTSIESATFEAHRRATERLDDEQNMAIAFYWYLGWFLRLNPGGVVSATRPAPLETADLEVVARQLAKEPSYQGQRVIQIARDGRLVRLTAGEVTVEAAPR